MGGGSWVGPPAPKVVYLRVPTALLELLPALRGSAAQFSLCSKRYEAQIQEYERKSEQHREALGRLQQEFQRTQGKVSVKT